MLNIFLLLTLFSALIEANPANSTAIPPPGPNETCQKTSWYDLIVFFIGNYIAHAATVKSYPGEATSRTVIATLGALLIPTSGLIRGLNSIFRNAKFKRKGILTALFRDPDYETAAASGSLVMVVRKKSWKPYAGDVISDVVLREECREDPLTGWQLRSRKMFKKRRTAGVFYNLEEVSPNDDSDKNPTRGLKVYRAPWSQECAKWWTFTDTYDEYVLPSKTVHGFYDFKDQEWSYGLAHVPRDAILAVRDIEHNVEVSPGHLEAAGTGFSSLRSQYTSGASSAYGAASILTEDQPTPVIAASYSLPKAMIAIVQLGFAIMTLYQGSGRQFNHYGYASFGLTVIPYALMSFVNLLGNMLTPDYQALYMVGSEVMDEAIRRGCRFDGVVGRLVEDTTPSTATATVLKAAKYTPSVSSTTNTNDSASTDEKPAQSATLSYHSPTAQKDIQTTITDYSTPSTLSFTARRKLISKLLERTFHDTSPAILIPSCTSFLRHSTPRERHTLNPLRTQLTHQGLISFTGIGYNGWRNLICFAYAAVVLAIIGGVTRFRSGGATNAQLEWVLHWYIFATVYSGYGIEDLIMNMRIPEPDMGYSSVKRERFYGLLIVLPLLFYGIPAIGGFVVVAQMLVAYGTCTFN